jgi:hypothetical protein
MMALDALAYLYASTGKLDKSKKMIERSFKLKPSITGHWTAGIAYAYVRMGNKKKALKLLPANGPCYLLWNERRSHKSNALLQ